MRSCSPVQYFKDGSKEMRLSLSISRRKPKSRKQQQQHHKESHMGGLKQSHGTFEKARCISNSTFSQQAYNTDGSEPNLHCYDSKQKFSLQNKGTLSFNRSDQSSIAARKRQEMPAKDSMMMDNSYQRVHSPCTDIKHQTMNDVQVGPTCQNQYLTYHLEKFPPQHTREGLSEKKRVALLKSLAQQLVSRVTAAEIHPSYSHNGNIQTHAVLLRNNLLKFQRELHAAVKALEGSNSPVPREKCSGYIVLPSKIERSESSEMIASKHLKGPQVGLDSMQHDSSSETTERSSVLLDSSSPQSAKNFKECRLSNREFSNDKHFPDPVVVYKKSSKAVLEQEMQHSMFQDSNSRIQVLPMDSKCEPTNQGKHTWDREILNKELEKLDAEIRETKSRMIRKLFLTHPPLADASSITSPLINSPLCSGNGARFIQDDGNVISANATTDQTGVFPNLCEDSDRLPDASAAALDDECGREAVDSTLAAEKICLSNEGESKMDDVKPKMQDGESVTITSLKASLCINAKRQSESSMEASPTYTSVRKVEVSGVAAELQSTGGLTVLFKKDMETNHKVLVDIITETLMQELLEYELSDMLLQGRTLPINRVKDIFSESMSVSRDVHTSYLCSDTLTSYCRTACASLKPSPDVFDTCVAGSLHADDDHQSYHNSTKEDCSSPAIKSPESCRESFKLTSERLVNKYIEQNLEASGLLDFSSLLELYASGKTMSLTVGTPCLDGREHEEQLYGKMVMEAICEWLDKKYSRFCLPSFFLFRLQCPEGPQLKRTLISKVNEHADAACEGGFSLENILEKSLDEEDWKTPYQEMMEVLLYVSDLVMTDLIENFLHDVMQVKQLSCASQTAMGLVHTSQSKALLCC